MSSFKKFAILVCSSVFLAYLSYYLFVTNRIVKGDPMYILLSLILVAHVVGIVYFLKKGVLTYDMGVGFHIVLCMLLYTILSYVVLIYIKRRADFGYTGEHIYRAPLLLIIIAFTFLLSCAGVFVVFNGVFPDKFQKMKIIYVSECWTDANNIYWEEYRLLEGVVGKYKCNYEKPTMHNAKRYPKNEEQIQSWKLEDASIPEWLKEHI